MEVLKFGYTYWKRNIVGSIIAKLLSVVALTCDVLQPLLTAMFIDYIIKRGNPQDNDTVFFFCFQGNMVSQVQQNCLLILQLCI